MSVQEIESLAQQFCDAFNKKDLRKALDMLSDDLEVFDHVPYRFDNKEQFAQFMSGAIESIASAFTGVTKDGKVQTIHGRTTLVFVKQKGQWKIVSAHFSPLPHAA